MEECKKLKQLIEDMKLAKDAEDPVGPIDEMTNEQIKTYIQNLKQKSRMLDKELRT